MNEITRVTIAPPQTSTIKIEAVNPHDLSDKDFVGIQEVSQDMWGSESGL